MGYYTVYQIDFEGPEKDIESFKKDLLDVAEKNEARLCIEDLYLDGYVEAKLYELTSWIDELAPKYPELLIMLGGDGEASDDYWEKRWKGDKTEMHEMVMPPFTELLTKEEKQTKNK